MEYMLPTMPLKLTHLILVLKFYKLQQLINDLALNVMHTVHFYNLRHSLAMCYLSHQRLKLALAELRKWLLLDDDFWLPVWNLSHCF